MKANKSNNLFREWTGPKTEDLVHRLRDTVLPTPAFKRVMRPPTSGPTRAKGSASYETLPMTWMLCAATAFGVMPQVVGLIFLMIDSLIKR